MKFFLKFFLLFLISISAASAQEIAAPKPTIIASINPIYEILLAITEDKNGSFLIIDSGLSEHNYQLKKKDVELFSKADLIFYVDDNLENAFAKLIKNFAAEKKSFQLSQVVGVRLLARRDDPKKIDPHLWLNPQNAIKIAEFMAQKICAIDAPNCRKYQKNSEKFIREIRATEKSIQDAFASVKVSNYIIFHDGYQYFENYFGLTPLYVMSYDQHRDLTIQDLRRFDELAASGQVKCVFGDSLNEKNSAAKLAQNYKIKFTILNSMKAEESPNKTSYPALLRRIAEGMVNCLK